MTQRWWAPSGPRVGPDEFDLQLLKPGGDSRFDLGAALLAYHRLGAAACEAVAQDPMPDEHGLVEALATARGTFAEPMVDSVSKSVGGGPYAGLLVRDVADAAEKGALDLFRAAVAKGVTPTLAVQRVGAVYGVPAEDLGHYRALACTPAASPVALQDAADKALWSFVEKVCTEECSEEVSKATAARAYAYEPEPERQAQDDPATPYYDARDASGRFARGSEVGPAEVGTRPQDKAKRREGIGRQLKRRAGFGRETKRQEEVVQAPVEQEAERTLQRREQAGPKRKMRRKMRANTQSAIEAQVGHRRRMEQERVLQRRPKDPKDLPRRPKQTLGASYAPIEDVLSYVLQPYQMADIQNEITGDRRVTGSSFINNAHTPSVLDDEEDRRRHESTSQELWRDAPIEGMPARHVAPKGVAGNYNAQQHYKQLVAMQYLESIGARPSDRDWDRQIEQEMLEVSMLNHLDEPNSVVFVHSPPDGDPPTVHHVQIEGARGFHNGTKHAEWEIDPNQEYKLDKETRFYDPDQDVYVNIMTFRGVEDFEKAAAARAYQPEPEPAATQDDPATPYYDARDESGQFTATPKARKRTSMGRENKRRTTIGREVKAEPLISREVMPERGLERQLQRKSSRRLTPRQQRVEQQLMRRLNQHDPAHTYKELPQVQEDMQYRVMTERDLRELLKLRRDDALPTSTGIYGTAAVVLTEQLMMGTDVDSHIRYLTDVEGEIGPPIRLTDKPVKIEGNGGIHDLADLIDERIRRNPDVGTVYLEWVGDKEVMVMANRAPKNPIVLVQFDDDPSSLQEPELTYHGTYQARDLLSQIRSVVEPDERPYAANVNLFKITTPITHLYRMGQTW